jgi:uncharacterized membrane protein YbaN (DUF454 family)
MRSVKNVKKAIYISAGSISLVLGTIGIFTPILPTTPLYLLTAWFYARSSDSLYNKAMSNKYFGNIVRNFQENKVIPPKAKFISISTLWVTILLSIYIVNILWVRILLLIIAICVTIHILSYRSFNR